MPTVKTLFKRHCSLSLCLIVLSVCGKGQTSSSSSAPLKRVRSQAALSILHAQLNALGGDDVWSPVHGVKLEGTNTLGATTTSFTWEDHWQHKYKFYRDTFPDGSRHRFLQDPDRQTTTTTSAGSQSTGKKKLVPPQMDLVDVLLLHMPGAAIDFVLKDTSYQITRVPVLLRDRKPALDKAECVRIQKPLGEGHQSSVDVTLCSSTEDHLPLMAKIQLDNLMDVQHPVFEYISYSGFSKLNGLSVPTTTVLRKPSGQTHSLTFKTVVINPPMNQSDFSGEKQ